MHVVSDTVAAAALAQAILAPDRARPIVAITTPAGSLQPGFDAAAFEREIGEGADVYLIPTGEPTWELAELLPERFEVYGGALRIWRPGVVPESDPYDHPLFLVFGAEDAVRQRRAVLDALRGGAVEPGHPRPARGEIVEAEVTEIVDYGAFLEVDGHRGLIHVSELSDAWVEDPRAIVEVGEVVRARVLATTDGRLAFSFREDVGSPVDPLAAALSDVGRLTAENDRLRRHVRELDAERRQLLESRRNLQERVRQLQRTPRGERAVRRQTVVAGEDDFRALVAAEYEARYLGDDRRLFPLGPYTLHPGFLESVLALEGVGVERVAEVCAHVVARRAHELPGLNVHQLKSGEGGAPQRVRARDGAKAWRCALQVETPSARRLHWWSLPGGAVELASVGVHDDLEIPRVTPSP